MPRHSTLWIAAFSLTIVSLTGCTNERSLGERSDAGTSTPENQPDGSSSSSQSGDAWKYGNSEDESAYCEIYSKAEATVDCSISPTLEKSRLASCTKLTPCYRSIFETDFLERQRACLEKKLTCSGNEMDACDELAGKTYTAGASIASACEQRRASCKQSGSKLELACGSLAALTADARAKTEECLGASTACADVVPCMMSAFGGACAGL